MMVRGKRGRMATSRADAFAGMMAKLGSGAGCCLHTCTAGRGKANCDSPVRFAAIRRRATSLAGVVMSSVASRSTMLSTLMTANVNTRVERGKFYCNERCGPAGTSGPRPFGKRDSRVRAGLATLRRNIACCTHTCTAAHSSAFCDGRMRFAADTLLIPRVNGPIFGGIARASTAVATIVVSGKKDRIRRQKVCCDLAGRGPRRKKTGMRATLSRDASPNGVAIGLANLANKRECCIGTFTHGDGKAKCYDTPTALLATTGATPGIDDLAIVGVRSSGTGTGTFISSTKKGNLAVVRQKFM